MPSLTQLRSARNDNKSGDFLSQEEVEALLMGVIGPHTDDDYDCYPENEARDYHLGTQERIVRGRMPTLELINESFARHVRMDLFKLIHRNAEVSVGPIRIQKYSEFIRNLVVPTCINIIEPSPLDGRGLFIFDPNFVFLVVDNVFGGDGRFHTRVEGRDFTPIENAVIDLVLNCILKCYSSIFSKYSPLTLTPVGREMNSQFAQVAAPSEIVVSTSFTFEFGGACADIHYCFPYSTFEPIVKILNSSMLTEFDEQKKRTRIDLRDIEVSVDVKADAGTLTLREISNLEPGDILPLSLSAVVDIDKRKFLNLELVKDDLLQYVTNAEKKNAMNTLKITL